MMTLFTDAMSYLPSHKFAHPALVPLAGHDLEPRNALLGEHFCLPHALHAGQRFAQPIEMEAVLNPLSMVPNGPDDPEGLPWVPMVWPEG